MRRSTNLPSTSASIDSLPLADAIGTLVPSPSVLKAIDPDIVGVVGAAGVLDVAELRARHAVERPTLGTVRGEERGARRLLVICRRELQPVALCLIVIDPKRRLLLR